MGILPIKLNTDESLTGSSDLAWMTKGEVILAYYQDLGLGTWGIRESLKNSSQKNLNV